MPPAWILDIFVAVMLTVAALSAARLAAARPNPGRSWPRQADSAAAHLLMGIAMAGMLAASVKTLPNGAWEAVFGVAAVWFAGRVVRDARANGVRALAGGHCAPHLVHSAAMVYMYAALTIGSGARTDGMGMSGGTQGLEYPTLGLVFALVLAGYSVWDLDQLSGRRYSVPVPVPVPAGAVPVPEGVVSAVRAAAAPPWDLLASPALVVSCRIAMGVTMAFMLFIMI
ncbi:MAG: DUF5134 domain-containing protein [Trebonia sp.]